MVNRHKKLLIVTDYFYPHWTGIAKSLLYIIEGIRSQFDITVLTVAHEKNLRKEEEVLNVKVFREDYIFSLSRSKYSLTIITKFIQLVSQFDIILINSPSSNIFFFTLIGKLFGKKIIIFHQGDLILPKGMGNRIIEKIFDVVTFLSCTLADIVSCCTKDYAEHSRILSPFLSKFHILPIPLKPLVAEKKSKMFRKMENLRKKYQVLLGFAGRFVEEKGFDILFDALPQVVKEIPNVHFVFAGERKIPYENFYEKNISKIKKIEEYITFLGLLKNGELGAFYKNLDFIIIPSRSDQFPTVQIEAMLLGVPSIVSDIPGARYLVKKTQFGLLFKNEDPEDLAEKIMYAIKHNTSFQSHYRNIQNILNYSKNVKEITNCLIS